MLCKRIFNSNLSLTFKINSIPIQSWYSLSLSLNRAKLIIFFHTKKVGITYLSVSRAIVLPSPQQRRFACFGLWFFSLFSSRVSTTSFNNIFFLALTHTHALSLVLLFIGTWGSLLSPLSPFARSLNPEITFVSDSLALTFSLA